MSHVKMFLMFSVDCLFILQVREQMLKEMCTALLEADVNMKLVGCLSRMSGKDTTCTHTTTHILELEHKLEMQQRLLYKLIMSVLYWHFLSVVCSFSSVET